MKPGTNCFIQRLAQFRIEITMVVLRQRGDIRLIDRIPMQVTQTGRVGIMDFCFVQPLAGMRMCGEQCLITGILRMLIIFCKKNGMNECNFIQSCFIHQDIEL
ncbi:hypothetical protein CEXT_159051 [Caerostris extrusa]|uniref:Uncharacterized protein n=1 Tax=Caerostris extrusa TaxID=172846 RepID=A0AAV4XNX7_CAEEX|nr:hypothetical protein CEXT_159051 [Caerostris extrusa]